MHKVVLVEDSEECRSVVKAALGSEVQLTIAKDIQEAKTILTPTDSTTKDSVEAPDLILLDLCLPDGSGFELANQLRKTPSLQNIPIYLMTETVDLAVKVAAFKLDVEDYLVKPVNPIELKARVQMRLRKVGSKKPSHEILKRGALTLDIPQMKTTLNRQQKVETLDLTSKEFKILLFLAKNEGCVYSRADLVDVVWGKSVHVLPRTVDSHVCGLRRKLKDFSSYIESVPGAGYRFRTDISESSREVFSTQPTRASVKV